MRILVIPVLLVGLLGDPVAGASPLRAVRVDTELTAADEVVPGTAMSYSVRVTAPSGAVDVEVGGTLPHGLAFAGGELCLPQGPAVVCTLDDLAPGETAAAAFQVDTAPNLPAGALSMTMWTNCQGCESPMSATASSQLTPQADLTLDEDGPSVIRAGRRSAYTLTVQNEGPSDSTNVVVTDLLPDPLTFVSGKGCSAEGRQVRCATDSIRPGAQHRYVVVVAAPDEVDAHRGVVNTATVEADTPDTDDSGDSASVRSRLEDDARLTIDVSTSTGLVIPGLPFDYIIQVYNDGPSPAKDVRITNALPAGFDEASACPGGTCTFGTIPAGDSRRVTLRTNVDSATPAGTITDTAAATCADCTGPATAASRTLVRPSADVSVFADVRPSSLGPGDQATYTLTLTNKGPSTATGMTVTDRLPEQLSAAPVAGCTLKLALLTCAVPSLAPGQSRTWTLVVRAPAEVDHPLTVLDRVSVSLPHSISDPQPDSESSSVAAELTLPAPRWPWALVGLTLAALLAAAVFLLVRRSRTKRTPTPH